MGTPTLAAIIPTTKSGITIALAFGVVPNFQKRKEERSIAKLTMAIIFLQIIPLLPNLMHV
jgi:hypothetical protein